MDRIRHIATGGTIDSGWSPEADTSVPLPNSIVPEYLNESVRLRRQLVSTTLYLKDSRETSVRDQDLLAGKVAEVPESKVLVTSGTFLMPDLARSVMHHPMASHFEALKRKVVFTGSLKPLEGFLRSDAGFNLGMSIAALEENINSQVSICMNGGIFPAEYVRKDLTTAEFSAHHIEENKIPYHEFDLITVGGTIDFELDGLDGLVPALESKIPNFFRESVKICNKFYAVNPFVKDSRNLEDSDLEMILEMIRRSKSNHILITTGMYKIQEIHDFIQEKLKDNFLKKIILTASRFPLAVTDKTDAPFNLGYSLGKIGFQKPGVYISLNGKIITESDDVLSHVYTPEEIEKIKGGEFRN